MLRIVFSPENYEFEVFVSRFQIGMLKREIIAEPED